MKSVLVINLDVKDNHGEAANGAKLALDLCRKVSSYSTRRHHGTVVVSMFRVDS